MIMELRKLISLALLVSLTTVLLFATVDRSYGMGTVGKFDISGATLEGKYLLGLVRGQQKLDAQGESKPAWTLVNYGLEIWRANFQEGDIIVTAKLNGNTGSDFAKDNGNNPLSISIGDPLSSSFATICLEGEGCLSGSPGQQKVGTPDQEPEVSATLKWNNTLDNLGVRAMNWALFPVTTGFIKSAIPQGPLDLTTDVLILPEDVSLYVDNGPFGFGRADPDLVLLSDQPGFNAIMVGTNGLSPFAEWKSITLDDRTLPKVAYQEPTTSGSFPSGQVFVPPAGTWTMKDPMTLDKLISSSFDSNSDTRTGFLNANIYDFLKTNLDNSGAVISFPANFETGEHVVTLTAGPSISNDNGNIIPVYGITGKEARTLSAKFLLMDPKFTLDRNQAYPGDTLNVTGSGFAPYSRVKIYAEEIGGDNVTIGEASTDSTGGFRTQVVRLPPQNSDFFQSWINGTATGDIRVKIDDQPFKARYSSVYIQEIVEGVTQKITYLQPRATTIVPSTKNAPYGTVGPSPSVTPSIGPTGITIGPVVNSIGPAGNVIRTAPGGTAITDFQWIGKDADMVGNGDNGNPDGILDGHFKLVLSLPSAVEIKSIAIYSAGTDGKPAGGQEWHSADTNHWILGVFNGRQQLNTHHIPSLGTLSGDMQLDLYASDSGWFLPGNQFLVEVTLGDGTKLQSLVTVFGVL